MRKTLSRVDFHICSSESFALSASKFYTNEYIEFWAQLGKLEFYLSIKKKNKPMRAG